MNQTTTVVPAAQNKDMSIIVPTSDSVATILLDSVRFLNTLAAVGYLNWIEKYAICKPSTATRCRTHNTRPNTANAMINFFANSAESLFTTLAQ